MKEDKLLACVCVYACYVHLLIRPAAMRPDWVKQKNKRKQEVKKWKTKKEFSQKEEISCEIRSHVDVVEPLRLFARDKRKEKEK